MFANSKRFILFSFILNMLLSTFQCFAHFELPDMLKNELAYALSKDVLFQQNTATF